MNITYIAIQVSWLEEMDRPNWPVLNPEYNTGESIRKTVTLVRQPTKIL